MQKRGRPNNPVKTFHVHIRMPPDIREWIERRAREEFITITSKVVQCLAAEMKRETKRA
jgi:hypothetical protein